MDNKTVKLTESGLKQLEEELEYLKTKKRKEVSEKIKAVSYTHLHWAPITTFVGICLITPVHMICRFSQSSPNIHRYNIRK